MLHIIIEHANDVSEPKFHHVMSISRKRLTKSQVNSDYFMMAIELKWSAICIGNHTTFLVQFGQVGFTKGFKIA